MDQELDMADWISGAMGVSKDTAYEWMEAALLRRQLNPPPLTREEIDEVMNVVAWSASIHSFVNIVRAVERAHGIF